MESVSEINFVHHSSVLVECNSEAVEEVLSVCLGEQSAIREGSAVSVSIGVVLNSFHNIS